MKNFPTLVAGVVYPGGENYLDDYITSLSEQTDREFDLMLINDGADPDLRKLFPLGTLWQDLTEKLSPAEIRRLLISKAAQNEYEVLIFTDTDDFFSTNRVSESKHNLKNYDFVFNEIALVNQQGKVLQEHFLSSINVSNEVTGYHTLQDKNYIGLGNSAINLSKAVNISIPKNVLAVDWWIYSVLLIGGARGKFMPEVVTFYRQHPDNFVGMQRRLTLESLKLGLHVKLIHFAALVDYADKNNLNDIFDIAHERLHQMELLSKKIKDNAFCERYITDVNKSPEHFSGWWSEIVPVNLIKDMN
jgi:hypothetical protein